MLSTLSVLFVAGCGDVTTDRSLNTINLDVRIAGTPDATGGCTGPVQALPPGAACLRLALWGDLASRYVSIQPATARGSASTRAVIDTTGFRQFRVDPRDVIAGTYTLLGEAFAADGTLLYGGGTPGLRAADLRDLARVTLVLTKVGSTSCLTATTEPGLAGARAFHTATELPDGTILLAGGIDVASAAPGAATAAPLAETLELYEPQKGLYESLAVTNTAEADTPAGFLRALGSALLLSPNVGSTAGGPYVVRFVGGVHAPSGVPAVTLDPARGNALGLVVLPDARAQMAIAVDVTIDTVARTASVAPADLGGVAPAAAGAAMSDPRPATPIVFAGGFSDVGGTVSGVSFGLTSLGALAGGATPLLVPRAGGTATSLAAGGILVLGGNVTTPVGADPAQGYGETWGTPDVAVVAPAGYEATALHAAVPLDGTRVLVAGGAPIVAGSGATGGTPSHPIYVIEVGAAGSATPTDAVGGANFPAGAVATLAAPLFHRTDGAVASRVLLAGGLGLGVGPGPAPIDYVGIVDVSAVPPVHTGSTGLIRPRFGGAATTLRDGSVMLTGGLAADSSGLLAPADVEEIYNGGTGEPPPVQCPPP